MYLLNGCCQLWDISNIFAFEETSPKFVAVGNIPVKMLASPSYWVLVLMKARVALVVCALALSCRKIWRFSWFRKKGTTIDCTGCRTLLMKDWVLMDPGTCEVSAMLLTNSSPYMTIPTCKPFILLHTSIHITFASSFPDLIWPSPWDKLNWQYSTPLFFLNDNVVYPMQVSLFSFSVMYN